MKSDKRKIFENVVFEIFKNEDAYDKANYQLMRAYDIYCKKVKAFNSFSVSVQYDIVSTACLMSMGSAMRQLRTIEILRTNKPVRDIERDYCPEFGYEKPEQLSITAQKLINK